MPLGTGLEPVASVAGRTVPVGNRQVRNLPRLNALHQVRKQLALAVRAPADFGQPLVRGYAGTEVVRFQLSTDPFFIGKVRDIVGLYLNPPGHAMALCVDEKSRTQPLERTGQCDCIQMGLGSRPIGRHRWSLSQPAARCLLAMPTFRVRSCRRRLWAMCLGWPCCGRGIPRGSGTGATAFPVSEHTCIVHPIHGRPCIGREALDDG